MDCSRQCDKDILSTDGGLRHLFGQGWQPPYHVKGIAVRLRRLGCKQETGD
jgi:hypothetical protein